MCVILDEVVHPNHCTHQRCDMHTLQNQLWIALDAGSEVCSLLKGTWAL